MSNILNEVSFRNKFNDQSLIAVYTSVMINTTRSVDEIRDYLIAYNAQVLYKNAFHKPEGVYGYTECESIHRKGLGVYFECINFTDSRAFSKHIVLKIHELLETYDYVVTTKHTENGPQEVIWVK